MFSSPPSRPQSSYYAQRPQSQSSAPQPPVPSQSSTTSSTAWFCQQGCTFDIESIFTLDLRRQELCRLPMQLSFAINLQRLDLSHNKLSEPSLTALSTLHRLSSLMMNDCGLSQLSHLPALPSCTNLHICQNEISQLSVLHILQSSLPQLTTLNLHYHSIITTLTASTETETEASTTDSNASNNRYNPIVTHINYKSTVRSLFPNLLVFDNVLLEHDTFTQTIDSVLNQHSSMCQATLAKNNETQLKQLSTTINAAEDRRVPDDAIVAYETSLKVKIARIQQNIAASEKMNDDVDKFLAKIVRPQTMAA